MSKVRQNLWWAAGSLMLANVLVLAAWTAIGDWVALPALTSWVATSFAVTAERSLAIAQIILGAAEAMLLAGVLGAILIPGIRRTRRQTIEEEDEQQKRLLHRGEGFQVAGQPVSWRVHTVLPGAKGAAGPLSALTASTMATAAALETPLVLAAGMLTAAMLYTFWAPYDMSFRSPSTPQHVGAATPAIFGA